MGVERGGGGGSGSREADDNVKFYNNLPAYYLSKRGCMHVQIRAYCLE